MFILMKRVLCSFAAGMLIYVVGDEVLRFSEDQFVLFATLEAIVFAVFLEYVIIGDRQ